MKAMIFAAGLGTRLRPLTDHVPKAMVKVGGQPMLQIIIQRCIAAGVREMVINVHYLADVIRQFLKDQNNFGIEIHLSDETAELLETGGGLWKARHYFEDGHPFLVANADILTNIDLQNFYTAHLLKGGLATLAVRNRHSGRKLLFDEKGRLTGRWDAASSSPDKALAFSGYHVIDPKIFEMPTREGKFSITDWYLDLCQEQDIFAYEHDQDIWVDIGNLEKLQEAEKLFSGGGFI